MLQNYIKRKYVTSKSQEYQVKEEMLRNKVEVAYQCFHLLCVRIWNEDSVPKEWTNGLIIILCNRKHKCYKGIRLFSTIGYVKYISR